MTDVGTAKTTAGATTAVVTAELGDFLGFTISAPGCIPGCVPDCAPVRAGMCVVPGDAIASFSGTSDMREAQMAANVPGGNPAALGGAVSNVESEFAVLPPVTVSATEVIVESCSSETMHVKLQHCVIVKNKKLPGKTLQNQANASSADECRYSAAID